MIQTLTQSVVSTKHRQVTIACINRYKMFQLRRKLMNLMDKQYQGRDGITDEVDEEKELEKSARFAKNLYHVFKLI